MARDAAHSVSGNSRNHTLEKRQGTRSIELLGIITAEGPLMWTIKNESNEALHLGFIPRFPLQLILDLFLEVIQKPGPTPRWFYAGMSVPDQSS